MRFRSVNQWLTVFVCFVFQAPATIVSAQSLSIGSLEDSFEVARNLTEISGLAVASENSVYAHDDEHGIVYEVSLETRKILAAFALGTPTVAADFEGIAAFDRRIYLITSKGTIYEAPIGEHRTRVRFNTYDTGVGEFCEIEGLTAGPQPSEFLVVCKTPKNSALENRLLIYKWNLEERLPVEEPWIDLPFSDFLTIRERAAFRPSAIEWRASDGTIMVLSARNQLLVQLSRDRAFVSKASIEATRHRQAEGLAAMSSGALIIADEGTLRLPGKISIYSPKN